MRGGGGQNVAAGGQMYQTGFAVAGGATGYGAGSSYGGGYAAPAAATGVAPAAARGSEGYADPMAGQYGGYRAGTQVAAAGRVERSYRPY